MTPEANEDSPRSLQAHRRQCQHHWAFSYNVCGYIVAAAGRLTGVQMHYRLLASSAFQLVTQSNHESKLHPCSGRRGTTSTALVSRTFAYLCRFLPTFGRSPGSPRQASFWGRGGTIGTMNLRILALETSHSTHRFSNLVVGISMCVEVPFGPWIYAHGR